MTTLPDTIERVGITGHRPKDFTLAASAWTQQELGRVLAKLAESGAHTLNCGFAAGSDLWAANEADQLGYNIEAFLPFDEEAQTLRWPTGTVGLYQRLLAKATEKRIYSTLPEPGDRKATSDAMIDGYHLRNEALVVHSDVVVAVWKGRKEGGTYHALTCAVRAQKPVVMLALRSRRTLVIGHEALAARLGLAVPAAA